MPEAPRDEPWTSPTSPFPIHLGIALGLMQLFALGVVAIKTAYRPGGPGPGGAPVEAVDEPRAVFGYFVLIVLGLLATVWYVRSPRPAPVLLATAAVAVLANLWALLGIGLLATGLSGLVFAALVGLDLVLGGRLRGSRRSRPLDDA